MVEARACTDFGRGDWPATWSDSQLRWEDVDLSRGTIRWRAETDKKGKEWVIPIPPTLCEEVRTFRKDGRVVRRTHFFQVREILHCR